MNMESKTESAAGSQRLVCVDALRGFDMLWIIGGAEVLISFSKANDNLLVELFLE